MEEEANMNRVRKPLAIVIVVAVAGAALVLATESVASKRTGVAVAKTVKISIPSSISSAAPVVLTVAVPKAGTTIGIDTPLHADPGQAAGMLPIRQEHRLDEHTFGRRNERCKQGGLERQQA